MRQLNKKKGMSLGDMYPAALTIVLIGVLLGVGIYVLVTFQGSIATDYSGSQNSINTSSGSTTLTDASLTNFNLSSLDTVVYNNGSTAPSNYSYTAAGVITWGSLITAEVNETVNVTYTYTYDATDSPEEAITTTVAGLGDFADWIAIIVVVIAAAVVLGVVLSSFGRRRSSI